MAWGRGRTRRSSAATIGLHYKPNDFRSSGRAISYNSSLCRAPDRPRICYCAPGLDAAAHDERQSPDSQSQRANDGVEYAVGDASPTTAASEGSHIRWAGIGIGTVGASRPAHRDNRGRSQDTGRDPAPEAPARGDERWRDARSTAQECHRRHAASIDATPER